MSAPSPNDGGQEAEALRSDVKRVGGEQRHEDVEVEADGRDDGHDREDQTKLRIVPRIREPAAKPFDHTRRVVAHDRP